MLTLLPFHIFQHVNFFSALLMACAIGTLQAQINFTNPYLLNHKNGLPHNIVYDIEQDKEGFIWLATADGLCNYDGAEVTVFKHNPNDSNSISSDKILGLFHDDRENKLWITTAFGLNILDYRTGIFKKYLHKPDNPNSLPDNRLNRTIYRDRQGDTWITIFKYGIARYNKETDGFEIFSYQLTSKEKGSRLQEINKITAIQQDIKHDSILWLSGGAGLLKFDKVNRAYKRFYFESKDDSQNITRNAIETLHTHKDGKLYLGTYSNGIHVFDPIKETSHHFLPTKKLSNPPPNNFRIYNISEKSNHELWITTHLGLVVYNTIKQTITKEWINEPEADLVYGANFIDHANRFWAWSKKGLFIHDPLSAQFEYIPNTLENKDCLPMKVLNAPEEKGLYVSVTYGKGLYLLNRETGSWKLIPPTQSILNQGSPFKGRGLLYLADGRLLQVEERGLYTLSKDGNSLIPFDIQPDQKNAKLMWALQDYQEDIWITSIYGGLFRINLKEGSIRNYQKELLDEGWIGENSIYTLAIMEDSQHNIWIKVNKGFSVYQSRQDTFYNFKFDDGITNPFIDITKFSENNSGKILIGGTTGNDKYAIGLADPQYPQKGITHLLDIQSEFDFRPVSIHNDAKNNFWVHDHKKLIKFDSNGHAIQAYDGYDGLRSYEGDPNTVRLNGINHLTTGEFALCYSGNPGIGIFHPDSLKTNQELPIPYLISFSVFDNEIRTDSSLFFPQTITLPYKQNFFSIEFSAINLTNGHKNQYKYKLEGLDPDWIYPASGRRYTSYSNVREGEYTFRLMAANNNGLWNPSEYRLSVTVLPPWYRSWLAYNIYVVFFITAFFVVYQFLKRRWKLKMEMEMEHRELLRLQELDNAKTRFYTNITHEFRTPLTVISGMTDHLSHTSQSKLEEAVEIIKRNSSKLLQLVNQLLDLRKLESGNVKTNMIQGDVILFLKYLSESMHSLAAAKGIGLSFETNTNELNMDYDSDKLQQIVSNLLSNAIKFTPEGGKVKFEVLVQNSASENIKLIISDTGIGIKEENLPLIFDRFYQIDNTDTRQNEGTGIGLALTKELIKLLGGDISVASTFGKGSKFTISLPITRRAPIINMKPYLLHENRTPIHLDDTPDFKEKKEKQPLLLIIEDNTDLVHYLKTCLNSDYQIAVAVDGKEGIQKALDIVPDLIISDVMMPYKDGFEVCLTLKNDDRTSHIPVILLTAKTELESRLKGIDSGADAYLPKPFNKSELLLRTRKLLELRKNLQQHYFNILSITGAVQNENLATKEKESIFILQVKKVIEDHLGDADFELVDLYREVGMSRSQLYRKITALTGQSPNRLIRSIRLAKAKTLLQESNLTIAEIAYDTGFSDPNYFTRVFTKAFGETPTQFKIRSIQ